MAIGKHITTREDGTTRTDYLYRVSVKALIYNEKGEILVVKEHGLNWGLPGGGMDHGETFKTTLTRELVEEVGYRGAFTFEVIDTADPMYLEGIDAWQIQVIFQVVPETLDFSVGPDAQDMKFIDVSELETYSDTQAEFALRFHRNYQSRLANRSVNS